MSFGEKIRKKREELGMTQEELSFKINEELSRQSISKWERGEAFPDVENLLALAKILDMKLDDMFSDELSLKDAADTENSSGETRIAVTNKFPTDCKTRNGGTVRITSVTADYRRVGSIYKYTICFNGTVIKEAEDSLLDIVLYKLTDSNGSIVDGSELDIENIREGESFSLRNVHLLRAGIGNECSVRFV